MSDLVHQRENTACIWKFIAQFSVQWTESLQSNTNFTVPLYFSIEIVLMSLGSSYCAVSFSSQKQMKLVAFAECRLKILLELSSHWFSYGDTCCYFHTWTFIYHNGYYNVVIRFHLGNLKSSLSVCWVMKNGYISKPVWLMFSSILLLIYLSVNYKNL